MLSNMKPTTHYTFEVYAITEVGRCQVSSATIQSNFFSASEEVGFSTPGRVNSQYSVSSTSKAKLNLRSSSFSPDNDGFEDLLILDYAMEVEGYVANVKIIDLEGRLVLDLANNLFLSANGKIIWDGLLRNGSKANMGVYLLLFEAFHPNGSIEQLKVPFVLAAVLND